MICFTYSAESYAKANKAGFISNEILCFNWKGEKIKKYLELNMQDKELITKIERIINERRKI